MIRTDGFPFDQFARLSGRGSSARGNPQRGGRASFAQQLVHHQLPPDRYLNSIPSPGIEANLRTGAGRERPTRAGGMGGHRGRGAAVGVLAGGCWHAGRCCPARWRCWPPSALIASILLILAPQWPLWPARGCCHPAADPPPTAPSSPTDRRHRYGRDPVDLPYPAIAPGSGGVPVKPRLARRPGLRISRQPRPFRKKGLTSMILDEAATRAAGAAADRLTPGLRHRQLVELKGSPTPTTSSTSTQHLTGLAASALAPPSRASTPSRQQP